MVTRASPCPTLQFLTAAAQGVTAWGFRHHIGLYKGSSPAADHRQQSPRFRQQVPSGRPTFSTVAADKNRPDAVRSAAPHLKVGIGRIGIFLHGLGVLAQNRWS